MLLAVGGVAIMKGIANYCDSANRSTASGCLVHRIKGVKYVLHPVSV